jgi:hypothetical protein
LPGIPIRDAGQFPGRNRRAVHRSVFGLMPDLIILQARIVVGGMPRGTASGLGLALIPLSG